ncbi:recombinase family protein [Arsenicicoccus bolidensis]|uniref:recombinase family protein n=1 Tax=Arsenicicoccus bolidensis TaxID=229480 RepID=UPI0003FD5A4C|nr:recombinase family protein [Arsenicicoccus bolidensis]
MPAATEAHTAVPADQEGLNNAQRAVAYIRVSTKEQAERGGFEEGFSIPAQRDAIRRAAAEAGAMIVEEFIDAGETATNARRPDLQRMLSYIKSNQVDLCIVHKLDRLARNRADDVAIHLALRQAGVTLVSVTENIDETPTGMLLHGIMSTIAEFYSRNLAGEVTKGLQQKAASGGTVTKAPLGYLNVRERDPQGREVRTVTVDPERAPLVAWAFEAYAVGNRSLSDLADELAARGLTSLPTPKRPAKPIGVSTLQRMLRNPYYKGDIVYKGARHLGIHDRLVHPTVWTKVQNVLDAHNVAGDRTQTHEHYLKGTLYCGCGKRMTINHARNRHGETYPYFICLGRHMGTSGCERQAVLVPTVERLVAEHYRTFELSPEAADALTGMIEDIFDRIDAESETQRRDLTRQKERLEDEQLRLLQAHYADAISLPVLKKEQHRIEGMLTDIDQRLSAYRAGREDAKLRLRAYLHLATNAHAFYLACDDARRRLCNQAFFTKITLKENLDVTSEFTGIYETILDPTNRLHAEFWQRTGQLHPDINLEHNEETLPHDQRGRVGTSTKWWS